MDTLALRMPFRQLSLPVALGGFRQGPCFLMAPVLVQTQDAWPGLWQKASLGQWVMAEQRPQERHPTAAKDTHEPPTRRPSWTRVANRGLTAVSAHERASTIPRRHNAHPVAWDVLKWGKCCMIVVRHWSTLAWQCMASLLGLVGA
jgi:hypothetical protein